ncbi:MAG: type II toxin-antitoxin system YafQ family toxin [Lachnospiraceae bacterium]|jgi:mRNA interferase YafQ|nr:type II toxin-antitoxin system YafQ family toxin [Lachnospiraceae bacterium]
MNKRKRSIEQSSQFRKDVRLAHKQGKDITLLEQVIDMLADDISLPDKHRDHALHGNWKGYRECHVTPDWLLVYRKTDNDKLLLILVRLASHSDLNF